MNALDQLAGWFKKCGVPAGDATERAAGVAALARRTGLVLPADFKRYLLKLAPGSENFDDELTHWWSLPRIRTIPEEYEHAIKNPDIAGAADRYLVFADYSIWCWAWAIACTDDEHRGRVAIIGDSDRFVAESFDAFIKLYLHDLNSVC